MINNKSSQFQTSYYWEGEKSPTFPRDNNTQTKAKGLRAALRSTMFGQYLGIFVHNKNLLTYNQKGSCFN